MNIAYWFAFGFAVFVFSMCAFAHYYTRWYYNKYCVNLNHTRCDGECYDCGKEVRDIDY